MRTWKHPATLLAVVACAAAVSAAPKKESKAWTDSFGEENADLLSTGSNPYFPLLPGYTLHLDGREDGKPLTLVVSVLGETKRVAGVETRVVEERETQSGQLVEVSRNYMATSKRTGRVYYFGEDVNTYKNGMVTGHEGSWLAGVNGARYGMMMPGKPEVGARFYQEIAPKVAMDRCEIVSASERRKTSSGSYSRVIKMEETTPLEPGTKEYKYYAPGVGLIEDGGAKLVRIEKPAGS